jgi:hypothetical protein
MDARDQYYKKILSVITDFRNKLECLSLVNFFQSSLTNILAYYKNS